jgi:hypothetical protein
MTDKELAEKTIYFLQAFLNGKTLEIFSNGRNYEEMDRIPPFFQGLVKDKCVRIKDANNN